MNDDMWRKFACGAVSMTCNYEFLSGNRRIFTCRRRRMLGNMASQAQEHICYNEYKFNLNKSNISSAVVLKDVSLWFRNVVIEEV